MECPECSSRLLLRAGEDLELVLVCVNRIKFGGTCNYIDNPAIYEIPGLEEAIQTCIDDFIPVLEGTGTP